MRLKDKVEQLRKIKCQMNDGKKMKEMVIEEKEIVLPVPNL